ncbi:MAG: ATP-dependent RNA helicase HrpA [Propionibacteriaceae bacterium]|nr:ATP-dependent RNA helicase HrpA [Propionibacteriaceae bacterium]
MSDDQVDDESDVSPNLSVDTGLPIAAHQAEIAALILGHQVVVVAGETGSGKTTQLPKICLALGRRHIGHTQPRRIAARSVATRVAAEIGVPLGDYVGYQVRFTAETSRATRLKVMTDGILLAEIARDRLLRRYDTIIIDEAHERSLTIDFLLGYIKQLLPKRPDLKVIITSATIDTARFAAHFGRAPIVEVSGRGYPIDVQYAPIGDKDQADAIVTALRTLPLDYDTLVFLAGEREIRDTAAAVEGARLRDTHVLPLYARLTLAEQARVFAPHEGRRVVLATNVAETSLTVPGIRAVIDPGFARISRYSVRTKVQRLPIEPISRASADQRAGRCGRVAPGICVRLYSQDDYLARPAFTEPEILRTNLASVILAMTQARLGDIADFPFVDAPDHRNVADGIRLLTELGAITGESPSLRLTPTGRHLAELPIDPALARIVLEGDARGCLREAIIVAAGLSVQDVRERPLDHRAEADAMHARFASDEALTLGLQPVADEPQASQTEQPARITVHTGWGDFKGKKQAKNDAFKGPAPDTGGDIAALLRLWGYLADAQRDLGGSQFRKLCQREYLSYLRVREWQDLVSQLRTVTRGMKMHAKSEDASMESVLRACLAGLLSHIGALQLPAAAEPKRRGPKDYLGARGARFSIAPDSVLARHEPPLVLAVELVETSRLWAHGVAGIDAEWAEQAGGDFVRRRYSEPFFSTTARAVLANEHTSLFGVPLSVDRRVDYAGVDAAATRAIFIQSGLVEGQLTARRGSLTAKMLNHNDAQREQVDQWEIKSRRRGLLLDDVALAAWFDARLPPKVVSGATLDAWLRGHEHRASTLMLTVDDLLAAQAPSASDYPDTWTVGPSNLGLDYHFAPGQADDGVTVDVPLGALAGLPQAPFTWGVPGQRLELATALVKGLPKPVRRHVVPAPEFARQALDWLGEHGEDHSRAFTDELARALTALTGEQISGWDITGLPAHLRPAFRVSDGQQTHVSRDLPTLQAELGRQVQATLAQATAQQARSGATWVFDRLPAEVLLRRGDIKAPAFPALQDARTAVKEVFAATAAQARRTHRQGVVRLLCLGLPDPSKGVLAHLSAADMAVLATGPYQDVTALLANARDGAVGQLLDRLGDPWQVRDQAAFETALHAIRADQVTAMRQVVQLAAVTLGRLGAVEMALARHNSSSPLVRDMTGQLDDLVFDGFLRVIPQPWLGRLPVWLDGAARRLEAASTAPARDDKHLAELAPVLEAYADLTSAHPQPSDEIDRIGYMIEELRLQIFAQPLRTRQPVSAKRVMTAIAAAAEQTA